MKDGTRNVPAFSCNFALGRNARLANPREQRVRVFRRNSDKSRGDDNTNKEFHDFTGSHSAYLSQIEPE